MAKGVWYVPMGAAIDDHRNYTWGDGLTNILGYSTVTSSVTNQIDTSVMIYSMSVLGTPSIVTLGYIEIWVMIPCSTIIPHLLDLVL